MRPGRSRNVVCRVGERRLRGRSPHLLWNPGSVDIYDAAEHKKDGPYVIGFSMRASPIPGASPCCTASRPLPSATRTSWSASSSRTPTTTPRSRPPTFRTCLPRVSTSSSSAPRPPRRLDPALRRANKSGVPIVLVDREVTSKDSYITFVTASDQALGRISAQWLAETLNFEGKVVMLGGLAGASPAENRIKAAHEVFNQYPASRCWRSVHLLVAGQRQDDHVGPHPKVRPGHRRRLGRFRPAGLRARSRPSLPPATKPALSRRILAAISTRCTS